MDRDLLGVTMNLTFSFQINKTIENKNVMDQSI